MHDCNVHPMKDQIYDRLQQKQTLNKHYHDQHAKDLSPLTEGQQVTVQDHVTGKWSPATIHSKCEEPRSYLVKTQNGSCLRRNRKFIRDLHPTSPPSPVPKHVSFNLGEPEEPTVNYDTPTIPASPKSPKSQDPPRSNHGQTNHGQYRTRSGRTVNKPAKHDM